MDDSVDLDEDVDLYQNPEEQPEEEEEPEEARFKLLTDGYRIKRETWNKLFRYQKQCVHWLWELHQNGVGGIVGDEMGLGKTVQLIAFLSGLTDSTYKNPRESYESLGPAVLVCPATLMKQWEQEFQTWCPEIKTAILHSSGPYKNKKTLIRMANRQNRVIITTYQGIVEHQDDLYEFNWHYIILDEGHKIRNPDAQVTIACKRFKTPHRLILSGSPIQNNLRELWSLFDFVYPGLLGTLPVFLEQFAIPITQGGYANATQVQVTIAFRCATVLRDTIKPFLLRRLKDDVKQTLELPEKNEQILFCRLTNYQRQLYQNYLDSSAIKEIIRGSNELFVGLQNLRKISNHPHLFTDEPKANSKYGNYKDSGKMLVVNSLLRIWHKQGHKVLLFTQGVQMMSIFERYLEKRNYSYLSMNGSTAIGSRQQLINRFNTDKDIFCFLLTTRVGGLGVNLCGATRVIIYDPDWNPATDIQARERAWRIGQNQQVTIYRLLTAGTIEEKIYHRQIFKQFLSSKILKDPKQRRFFKTNDLFELFSLGTDDGSTESSAIFAGTGSDVQINKDAKNPKKEEEPSIVISEKRLQELRERIKKINQTMFGGEKSTDTSKEDGEIEESSDSNETEAGPSNKEKDHEKEKTKKIKGIMFEGEHIKYLVKHDSAKTSLEEDISKKQDDYVLKKLFEKTAMHSAIQHDVIETAATPDYAIVETEAEKVASDAIKALKRSRTECFRASSGIPSWTGLNGHKRLKRSTEGNSTTSSSSVLNTIRSRQRLDPGASTSSQNEDDDTDVSPQDADPFVSDHHKELLTDMRYFFVNQARIRGKASTQDLLNKFKGRLPSKDTPVFKALLHKLCTFHRKEGVGFWNLREEFM